MSTKNDITGDALTSRASNAQYRDGWDRIFGSKKPARGETQAIHHVDEAAFFEKKDAPVTDTAAS